MDDGINILHPNIVGHIQADRRVVEDGTHARFDKHVGDLLSVLRRNDEPPPRRAVGPSKIVVGPTLRDGVWCRMVADPDGFRRVEVLSPQGWVPSHRNVAHLLQAIPGRSESATPSAPSKQ